jgi:hypothetical protein
MSEKSDQPVPQTRQAPSPREKLVKVFDSERESEALIVSGLLESAGIDSDVTSTDAAQDMFPGVGGSVILVREDQAGEARRIIEEYRQSDESAEGDLNEEPPPGQ